MIDLQKLYDMKEQFGFYARLLMYPEKLDFHPNTLAGHIPEHSPGACHVQAFWENMHELSLEQIQEWYVRTFDFQKNMTLYMTYAKYEDSKERGQMLAKIKMVYEMFGLEMPAGELSDFLPLMCEFLYAAEWGTDERAQQSFNLLFAVLEDGTYHLVKALEKEDNPYADLIRGLRETLRACVVQEATEQ